MPRRVRTDAGMQLAGDGGGATPSIILVSPTAGPAAVPGVKGIAFDDAAPVSVPIIMVGYNFSAAGVALTVEDPMAAGTTWNITNLVVTDPTPTVPGSLSFDLDSNGVNPVVGSYNFRIEEDGNADIIALTVTPAA